MVEEDQKWRGMIRKISNNEESKISKEEAISQVQETDSKHYPILQQFYKKYGFVGFDEAGEDGSHNFWLLVQHQDRHVDFQLAVLEDMKIEAEKENASYTNYAYLIDRVKVNQGEPQVYGTQMILNETGTSYMTKPVIDRENLDKRRAEAGLPPIESYIKIMNERFIGNLKKE